MLAAAVKPRTHGKAYTTQTSALRHDVGKQYKSATPKAMPITLARISMGSARHGALLAGVIVSAVNPATAATGPPSIPETTNIQGR